MWWQLPSRSFVMTTVVVATVASAWMAMAAPATIKVDGVKIVSDVPAIVPVGGKGAYVPLRAVSGGLGAYTKFDARTNTIEVTRGNDVLTMKIGDQQANLNGHAIVLKHAPFLVRGRTMVALSTVASALGSSVHMNKTRSSIDVDTPGAPASVEAGAQDDGQ